MEEQQLRTLSTVNLVKHALAEVKLLARAEVLHAKHELREEISAARTAGILLGGAVVLSLTGVSLLFVCLALALPIAEWLAVLLVGGALIVLAGGLGFVGAKRLPKRPLAKTQERLKLDVALTREELQ